MGKELDKLKTEFKKLQPKCKPYTESAGTKIKKSVIAKVNAAWDIETEVREAIQKAIESGEKGKKLADFESNSDFSKSFKEWKKATGEHKSEIKALSEFCGEAEKLRDTLKSRFEKVEKELKKEKPSGGDKKETDKFLASVKDEIESLTEAANVYGTLKFVELFYAAKEDATMQVILKKTVSKSSGGELPKVLEAGARKKGQKQVEKLAHATADAYDDAYQNAEKDPKDAAKKIKLGDGMLDKLTKLNKTYQDALKKQKKEIEASTEKKEIMALIELVADFLGSCKELKSEAEKALKKAA